MSQETKFTFMRALDVEYQRYCERSTANAPRNGDLPIGGGEWMDSFFRSEALRGILFAMRRGRSLWEGMEDGRQLARIAVEIWNGKREWQVHRSKSWIDDFITDTIWKIRRELHEELR